MSLSPLSPTPATEPNAAPTATTDKTLGVFAEEDGPSFWDFLDVINPLQHIPIVNTLYREITGDKIGVGARLAGGTLFGGPIGLIASFINCAIENSTGQDVGEHVLALFKDEAAPEAPAPVQVAEAPAAQPAELAAAQSEGIESAGNTAPLAAPFSLSESGGAFVTQPAPVQKVEIPAAAPIDAQPVVFGNRFMPVPNRSAVASMKAPPPIAVPISVSGQRSNVPITGHNPLSPLNASPDPVVVQKALAQQGLGGVAHPAIPDGRSADWFSATMGQALDKYERGNRLGRPAPGGATGP